MWVKIKIRILLAIPAPWLRSVFEQISRRKLRHLKPGAPEHTDRALFFVTYRGKYIRASSSYTSPLHYHNIIYFSGPLKCHKSTQVDMTTVDRSIGSPAKLVTDVLLRHFIRHPHFIKKNFKRHALNRMAVGNVLVYGYEWAEKPYDVSRQSTLGLYEHPETYCAHDPRHFVEELLLPKCGAVIAYESDGNPIRAADGLLSILTFAPQAEIVTHFRMTLCAYSYGGEFIHQMRNCLVAYLSKQFTADEISEILAQVLVISAGSNNPFLPNLPNFRTVRIVNIYDDVVIKKLNLKAFYPFDGLSGESERVVAVNPLETLIWIKTPYRFDNSAYHGNTQTITQIPNYSYHLERAYFNPFYFPDTAYNALVEALTAERL